MAEKYKLVRKNDRNAIHVLPCDQWIFIPKSTKQNNTVTFRVAFTDDFKYSEPLDWELWTEDSVEASIDFLNAIVQLCIAEVNSRLRRKSK